MNLISQFNTLESSGLVRLVTARPELEYLFRHALVQDAAYGSLLRQDRKQLHLAVGEALERLYPDQRKEQAATLALHFEKAGVCDKAAHYFRQAGDRARASYANAEAVAFYEAGARQIETLLGESNLAAPVWQPELIQLFEDAGDLLELSGQLEPALGSYDRALARVPLEQPVQRSRLLRKLGKIWMAQQPANASQVFDEAEKALGSEPVGPARDWWQAWLQIQLERNWLLYMRREVEQLAALIEKTWPVLEQHGTPSQRAHFMIGLINLSQRRNRYAPSKENLSNAQAGLAAAYESGELRVIANHLFVLGLVQLFNNTLTAAEANLQSSYQTAERIGDLATQIKCSTYLSILYRRRGQIEATRQQVARLFEAATQDQMSLYLAIAHANTAWLAWREGRLAEALQAGQAALEIWQQLPTIFPFQWPALITLLAVFWRLDKLPEAVGYARRLLAPEQQYLPDELTSALAKAVQTWEQGQPETVRATIEQAIGLAQAHGYL